VPGTLGTLAALPFYLLMTRLSLEFYFVVLVLSTLAGVHLCDYAAKKLGVHDHGGIVWDEFVGFWITMVFVPSSQFNLLMGFAFFRIFDIVKPWPIQWFDKKVGGGLGVMLDDVIAGLFAGLSLWGLNILVYP
jgi:phosphatidylglycerophosphatase A